MPKYDNPFKGYNWVRLDPTTGILDLKQKPLMRLWVLDGWWARACKANMDKFNAEAQRRADRDA